MTFQENLIDIVDKMTPQEHYELLLELLGYPLPQGFSLHKCMRCGQVGWVNEKTHSSSSHFDKNNIGSLILYCNNCISNCTENGQKNNGIEKKELKSVIPIRIFSTDGDIEFDSEKDLEQWNEKYKGSECENFSRSSDLISSEIETEREICSEIDEELESEEDLEKWIDEKREKRRSMERNFIKRIQSEEGILKKMEKIEKENIDENIEIMRNLLKTKILEKISTKSKVNLKSPVDYLFHISCRIDKIGQYLKKYIGMFIPMHSCDICNGKIKITCQTHYLISSIEKILENIRNNKVKSLKDKLKNLDTNLKETILFYENLIKDVEKNFKKQ